MSNYLYSDKKVVTFNMKKINAVLLRLTFINFL